MTGEELDPKLIEDPMKGPIYKKRQRRLLTGKQCHMKYFITSNETKMSSGLFRRTLSLLGISQSIRTQLLELFYGTAFLMMSECSTFLLKLVRIVNILSNIADPEMRSSISSDSSYTASHCHVDG